MDRSKSVAKRSTKGKVPQPPGDFIALGSKTDSKLSSAGQSRKTLSSGVSLPLKRDSPSLPGLGLTSKKPKLSQTFTPLGRPGDAERRGSPTVQVYLYEELAKEVDPVDFLSCVNEAEDSNDDEKIEALLCGAVKYLKMNRAKPDPATYLALMHLARSRPSFFGSEVVIEAFCSLLKRDVSMNFKAKGNALVSVLTCNVMMAAFQDEENWPDSFVKILLEDSLGERVWVDRPDCKMFVQNVQSAFNTKFRSTVSTDTKVDQPVSAGASPSQTSSFGEDEDRSVDSTADNGSSRPSSSLSDDISSFVFPRYTYQQVGIETNVLDLLRDHLTRRQPMDGGSRNLLRVMSVACGYSEVRTMAAQRLEMWLQNPKLTRPAQDLLMAVCMNCDQHSQQDVEVMSQISKIRLKTKVLINHHLFCIRELLNQHPDNLKTLMMHAIYNELSNSRNPNNMSLLSTMFNHSPELSARVLADIFQDLLCNRDDYLRAVRALLREIVKAARHDFNFNEFALGLMEERDFHSLEPPLKDRMFLSLTDLISLTELLCITPSVREAVTATARGCHKDTEQLRTFQKQIATIQRDAIWWLHTAVPKMFDCKSADYIHCLKKTLFMEKFEYYYKMDNWPPEVDRGLMLRLVCEVPVYENTLMRVLLMGLTRELQVTAADSLELADQLVRRAAPLYSEDFPVLQVEKLELIDAVLNLCSYHHPENIVLPKGYEPPTLAISNLYWKAWTMLLIISAFNPATFGLTAWDSYPTLKCLMEVMMTNNYKFPPPTMGTTEQTVEEIKSKEKQVSRLERQCILEFEGHLAAGTSKVPITENNSLLLPQLITMDPTGIARRPPGGVLEQLKLLNQNLSIGSLLCRSRSPDFLLDVIHRQGTSQAMPWLAELVESSESSLDVLPVQCLCEFLLHDVPAEGSSSLLEDDDELKAEKYKRKHKKQRQLLGRLRSLLHDTASGTHTISEVLTHFLKRLSSTHSSTRQLAVKGLSMVLSTSQTDHDSSDIEIDPEEAISNDQVTSGHAWLLEQLPSLPGFDGVCTQVYHSLRQACQTETDAVAVGAYVIFLSQHTDKLQMQEMDELAADMAQLIVDRTTLMNHLLQRHHPTSDHAQAVLAGLLRLFMNYLSTAQQPHTEAYSWSNTQDQILLQWETGESATINIIVVHAMIIILTYGRPHGESDFERMLETWFPQGGHPPSAFLVDTSEEALLLPDWLKLRMIRCSTERLVDAAMQDLESSQLLLFIQSFGIPTASMGKLLRYLDRSVAVDSGAIQQLVVDKDYMIQLIDIQHMRGATGGRQFRTLLQQHAQTPSTKDVDMEVPVLATRRRTVSQLCRTPVLPQLERGNVEQVKSLLLKIFPMSDSAEVLAATERQQMFRSLQKGMLKEDVARTVLTALDQLLSSDVTAGAWRAALHCHTHLGCALARTVLTLHQRAPLQATVEHLMQLIATGGHTSNSPLDKLVRDFLRQRCNVQSGGRGDATVAPPGEDGGTVINEKTSIEQIIAKLGSCDQLEHHLVASITKGIREGRNKEMTQFVCFELTRLHKSALPISLAGLLVDWLELLDPEVIALCPDVEQQLLFAQRESGDASSSVGVPEHRRGFNQSYLLALVTHQCNWSTIRQCVRLLVDNNTHRFNPTSALDFLSACMHIPALWQGRDKKLPKNYTMEDVLRLRPHQTLQVIKYIIAEAIGADASHQVAPEECALRRVPLLLQCCSGKQQLVLPVIKHLVEGSSTMGRHGHGGLQLSVCVSLLHDLYLHLPDVVTLMRNTQWVASEVKAKQNSSSQLDVICHQLLSALGNAGHGKTAENRMYDANIACRQLASHHPTLLLRQLPMLAALLQGRAQFTFNELRHRNHLLLYTHLLGILELVQPALFHPDYSAPFSQMIHTYCQLIHIHGLHNKLLASIVTKFIRLLHSFLSHDPALASQILHPHVPLLNELIYLYPDFLVLRSLLAGLTLPRQERSEILDPRLPPEEASTLPMVVLSRPSSPLSATELAPFLQKIAPTSSSDEVLEVLRDLDEMSKRKVDILQHFMDELRRLMTSSNGLCCSLAHTLMMRHMRHNPRCAPEFVSVFIQCLESSNQDIVNTALKNLAEFVLFAQDDASVLLQKTFAVGIVSKVDTSSFICDALQLLNTETLVN